VADWIYRTKRKGSKVTTVRHGSQKPPKSRKEVQIRGRAEWVLAIQEAPAPSKVGVATLG
jgi:hypothetical protein